jgi:uncharacterized protein YlzI (FlbEa/FlbD family)
MNYLKLTLPNGDIVYVNPRHIEWFSLSTEKGANTCFLLNSDNWLCVRETPEEIAGVLEKANIGIVSSDARKGVQP